MGKLSTERKRHFHAARECESREPAGNSGRSIVLPSTSLYPGPAERCFARCNGRPRCIPGAIAARTAADRPAAAAAASSRETRTINYSIAISPGSSGRVRISRGGETPENDVSRVEPLLLTTAEENRSGNRGRRRRQSPCVALSWRKKS